MYRTSRTYGVCGARTPEYEIVNKAPNPVNKTSSPLVESRNLCIMSIVSADPSTYQQHSRKSKICRVPNQSDSVPLFMLLLSCHARGYNVLCHVPCTR